jgi:bifunctional DNase/RNase
MIEMRVRTVDHDPRSGRPVAVLLPHDLATWSPLVVAMQPSEACSLTHELERQATPRARAIDLLVQSLAAIGAYAHSIVLRAGETGEAVARLRLRLPNNGQTEHPLDLALALGLAVHAAVPVLVAERLARRATAPTPAAWDRPDGDSGHSASSVPAPFRRALGDQGHPDQAGVE